MKTWIPFVDDEYMSVADMSPYQKDSIMRSRFSSYVLVCIMVGAGALAATYKDETETIACKCRTITLNTLTSADYDQGEASQNAAWATFKTTYPGIVDADRVANRTYTYNCHSYCYNGSDRWLPLGAASLEKFYDNTGAKCWKADATGTVKSKRTVPSHSCFVADNEGKRGPNFACKNNQHVYASLPTDIYKQNP